jgi:3-oxoacyl-[acyl-carrier-protein] synthase II
MKKLLITGTGVVSPIGTGRQDIWNAVECGTGGIRRLTRFSFPSEIFCGEIRDFDLGDYMRDKRFRRIAPISQYALASMALALTEAAPSGSSADTALFMGISHGALNYTQAFHKELIESGPEAVSPIHFSDSVLNAPAGNASICFGLKGAVHTVLGGREAVVKSMMMAGRMLDDGEIERAIVVAAEELDELSFSYYTRLGFSSISEGAGAIVIEREGSVTESAPYCYIAGMGSECNPSDPSAALENSLDCCMARAGLSPADIDLVMSDSKSAVGRLLQGAPRADLTSLMGNAFGVSMLWETAVSAMAVKRDAVPQAVITGGGTPPADLNNVLIFTADKAGNAAAIILSRYV